LEEGRKPRDKWGEWKGLKLGGGGENPYVGSKKTNAKKGGGAVQQVWMIVCELTGWDN